MFKILFLALLISPLAQAKPLDKKAIREACEGFALPSKMDVCTGLLEQWEKDISDLGEKKNTEMKLEKCQNDIVLIKAAVKNIGE